MNDELGEITPCYTITFRRTSKHSAKRVWAAITEPDQISAWMDYPATVKLAPGGEWHVDFSRTNEGALEGVIVRVEPERLLAYVWGMSVVEWTLEDIDGGCRYQFVHQGLADRGDGEEGLPAGWHEFLDRLDRHLDGATYTVGEQKANWERLKGPYLERLNRVLIPRKQGSIRH